MLSKRSLLGALPALVSLRSPSWLTIAGADCCPLIGWRWSSLCQYVRMRRDVLEAAGPAFIKWGQWAATRHDLFPPDFCAILEHLHTQVGA